MDTINQTVCGPMVCEECEVDKSELQHLGSSQSRLITGEVGWCVAMSGKISH